MQRRWERLAFVALLGLVLVPSGVVAGNKTAKADDTTKTSSSAQSAAASDYVGSAVCMTCHEDIYKGWKDSALEDDARYQGRAFAPGL